MKELYVGKKHIMNYLVYAITALNTHKKLVIRARGQKISRAVNLAELLKRYSANLSFDIEIGSEEFEVEGKLRRVSTIAISVTKT